MCSFVCANVPGSWLVEQGKREHETAKQSVQLECDMKKARERNKIEMKDSTKAHSQPNDRIRHPKETSKQSTTASVKACDEKRNKQKQKEQKRQTCPAIMAAINVIMA